MLDKGAETVDAGYLEEVVEIGFAGPVRMAVPPTKTSKAESTDTGSLSTVIAEEPGRTVVLLMTILVGLTARVSVPTTRVSLVSWAILLPTCRRSRRRMNDEMKERW